MKKEYETPKFEIQKMETEDIIMLSGNNWSAPSEDGTPESGSPDIFSIW